MKSILSNRKFQYLGIGLLATAAIAALILADLGINSAYNQRIDAIRSFNLVAAELGKTQITPEFMGGYSPLSFPLRAKQFIEMNSNLQLKPEYERQKQQTIAEFNNKVSVYLSQIVEIGKQVGYIPTSKLDDIDFQIEKTPDAYIATLKSGLLTQIVKYNSTNSAPIRYQFDPAKQIASMSLEQKLGQLFQFGIEGQTMTDGLRQQLADIRPGGVSFFGENVAGETQLTNFTKQIQTTNPEIPLLTGVDQEGGSVRRLWWEIGGSEMQVADLEAGAFCDVYLNRSNVLLAAGINWNFGIVADATTNAGSFIYPRIFSLDYGRAALSVGTAVSCTNKTLSTLKHWPGHGATTVDTHSQIGKISKTQEQWQNEDLKPFTSGIAKQADSIMLGHLIMPWLDENLPASICAKCIAYLRNDLHFTGLVVTDDLKMLTASGYTYKQAAEQALLAGVDIVVINVADRAGQQELVSAAKELVSSGKLSQADLDAKLARILAAKNKVIGFSEGYIKADLVF